MARKRSKGPTDQKPAGSVCLIAAKGERHEGDTTVHKRGLCLNCFRAAARIVRETEKSWADLEAEGLALPDELANRTPFFRVYSRSRLAQ